MTSLAPSRETPTAPTGRRYVQLVMVLGALIALGPLSIDMYLPAFPRIADDLSASDSAVQLTLTGMLLGLAVGQLVIGPLSDAFGRRRPLVIGLAAHAGASLLCAVAPTVGVLAGVRVVQGLAGAALSVVAMAIVRDLFSGVAVARIMSRLMLVIGLAPILAPTLGGIVLGFTSWRGIFVVLAGAALLLVVVAAVGIRETLPVSRRRPATVGATLAAYRTLLGDRVFVGAHLHRRVDDGGDVRLRLGGVVRAPGRLPAGRPHLRAGLRPQRRRPDPHLAAQPGAAAPAARPHRAHRVDPRGDGRRRRPARGRPDRLRGLAGVLVPLALLVSLAGLSMPNTPALALTRHGEAAGTAAAVLGCCTSGSAPWWPCWSAPPAAPPPPRWAR